MAAPPRHLACLCAHGSSKDRLVTVVIRPDLSRGAGQIPGRRLPVSGTLVGPRSHGQEASSLGPVGNVNQDRIRGRQFVCRVERCLHVPVPATTVVAPAGTERGRQGKTEEPLVLFGGPQPPERGQHMVWLEDGHRVLARGPALGNPGPQTVQNRTPVDAFD